jgi:polyhydroxyalkanoate synthesis regulator protein
MFEQAMRMFLPFGTAGATGQPKAADAAPGAEPSGDLDTLRRQLDELQKRLDKISDKS